MARKAFAMNRIQTLRLPAVILVLGSCCLAQPASAAIYIWGNTDTDFSTPANWSTNVVPGPADIGQFNGSSYAFNPAMTLSGVTVGGLWDTGTSPLALSGSNTLTINGLTINGNPNAGIEIDPGAGSFSSAAPIALGGTQTWLFNNSAGNAFTGSVAMGSSPLSISGIGSTSFSGALTGSGGFQMAGGGVTTLYGGSINYTGTTAITAGTLQLFNATGSNFPGGFVDSTNLVANAANGMRFCSGGTLQGAGTFTKTGNSSLLFGNGSSSMWYVAMSPGASINVQAGTLRNDSSDGNWTANKASMYVAAGATVDLWDSPGGITVDALNGSGTVQHTSYGGSENFTVGVANGSGTFGGTITDQVASGHVLNFVKQGTGLQVLTGTVTYSGSTAISAGTLQIGAGGASGAISGSSAIVDNATLVVSRSDGATLTTPINGSGKVVLSGGGTYLAAAPNSYTGATNINGSLLRLQPATLAAANAPAPLIWFDPSNPSNYTLSSGSVSQLLNLSSSGAGNAAVVAGHNIPTLTVNNPAFNGLTTVHFSGGQVLGGYNLSALNGSSYATFGVLAKASSNSVYLLGTVNGSQDQGMHFGFRSDTTFTFAQYGDDLNTPTTPGIAYTGSEVAQEWTGMLNTGSGKSVYMNGAQMASNTNTGAFNSLSVTNFGFIGAGYNFGSYFNGDAGEVLIFASSLTTAQRQGVEAYLQDKWEGILPSASPVTISSGGTLDLNGANQTIGSLASSDPTTRVTLGGATLSTGNDNTNTLFAGTIGGAGNLTKIGSGQFTLTAANLYSGTTTISAGTLQIGNGGSGASIAGTVGVVDNGVLAFNSADSFSFSAPISGAGMLSKAGSGRLTLTTANSYTGGNAVSGGTLQVGGPGALGSGGLAANAGLVDLNGNSLAIGSLTGLAGTITDNSGGGATTTLTVNQTAAATFSGTLVNGANQTLALTKSGTGLLVLAGGNGYTGATNITSGVLEFATSAAVPAHSTITITNGAALAMPGAQNALAGLLNGGNLATASSGILALAGGIDTETISMANYPSLSLGALGSATFSGVLTPNLASNTYYLGGGGGTLSIASPLGGGSGALFAPGYLILGASSFTGSSTISSGATVLLNSSTATLPGSIQLGTAGTGTAVLQLGAANQLGPNCVISGNGTTGNAAYLKLMGYNQTVGGISATNGAAIIENTEAESNAAAATLTVNTAGTYTYNGYLRNTNTGSNVGTLNLVKAGSGMLTLLGANITYSGSGTTLVSGGSLQFQDTTGSRFSGGITDNATVIENAATAQQQYNGGTLLGSGTFTKSGTNSLLFGANGSPWMVSMSTGALINVQSGLLRNEYSNGNWVNNQASMYVASSGTVDLWDSGGGITVDALNGAGTVQHTSYGGTENFTVGVAGGSGTFNGVIQDTAGHSLTLVKKGSGTQVLTGPNTYTGGTSLVGGVLSFANGALGTGNISVAGNATLQWYGSNTQDISSQLQAIPSAFSLSLDTNGNSINLASGPSGAGTVRKAGAGTLTLNSPTNTGLTAVNSGTLVLAGNAALPSQSVTVNSGATLSLTAYAALSGPSLVLTVAPGGVVDASAAYNGLSIGAGQTLTAGRPSSPAADVLGNFTLNGGNINIGNGLSTIATLSGDGSSTWTLGSGTVNFDLTSTPTSNGGINDTINVANLAVNGPVTIDVNSVGHGLNNGTYNLFNFSGGLTGSAGNLQLAGISSNGVRQTFNLITTGVSGGAVQLQVSGNAANLTWTGSSGNSWDVTTTQSWNNAGAADFFYNNDVANFGDTAVTGNLTINAAVSPGGVIFNNNTLTYTISSGGYGDRITGNTGLTKSGSGTVILACDNDYIGSTQINGGVLMLASANAVQNSTVNVSASNGLAFAPAIAGGTFNLGGLAGQGGLTLADTSGSPIAVNLGGNGAATTYSGAISGPGSLVENGPGAISLSGNNTFSGNLSLNGGIVTLAGSNAAAGSTVAVGAGALGFAGGVGTFNLGGLSGNGAVVLQDANNGPVNLAIGGNGQTTVFSGTLSGGGGVTMAGSGNVTLQGNGIAYYGPTTISSGTLQLQDTTSAPHFSGGITDNGNLVITSNNQMAFGGGVLQGSGTLTKYGNSALLLGQGGAAWYVSMAPGSLIDVEAGTLRNEDGTGYWTNNKSSLNVASNATVDLWDGPNGITVDALNGAGTVQHTSYGGPSNLTIGVVNGSGTFSGVITDQPANNHLLSLVKQGTGIEVLAGNNTYSGSTAITAGTLQVGAGGYSGALNNTSSILNNGTLVFNRADGTTLQATISGSGNLVATGGGTYLVTAPNTYSGATTINGGVLRLQTPTLSAVNAPTPLIWFDPSNPANYILNGANVSQLTNLSSGTAGNAVAISGRGTPTITASNSAFNGLPTLHFAGGQELGGYNLSALNGSSYTILAVLGKATNAQTYLLGTVNGAQDQGMHFGFRADTQFTFAQYGDDLNTPTLPSIAYTGSEVAQEWTGMLNTSTGKTLYLNGTQEATTNNTGAFNNLSSTNYGFIGAGFGFNSSFNGDVGEVLIYSSTLSQAQRQAIEFYLEYKWETNGAQLLPGTTPVTITGGGTFDLNGANQTIGSLTSSDPTTQVTLGGAALTTGNDNTNTIFAGTISGPGNLAKIGSGVFTLTGPNSYTGTTTVSGGTLQIGNGGSGGSIASTSAVVDNATLVFNSADSFTFSPPIGGSGSVIQAGTGELTLAGSNSYAGGTTVTNGTLQLGALNALGSGGLTSNAGVLDLNGYATTVGWLRGVAGSITDLSAGGESTTLTVNQAIATTFSGTIADGQAETLALAKAGTGALLLASSNHYSGGTIISAGLVIPGNNGAFGSGPINVSGGEIDGQFALTISNPMTLSGTGALGESVRQEGGTKGAFTGPIALAGNTTVSAEAGATLTFSGSVALNGNTLTVNSDGTVAVNGNIIADPGALVLQSPSGMGTLVLSGSNLYGGGTFVNSGTLIVSSVSALAAGSNLSVGTGGASFSAATPGVVSPAVASVPEPGTLVLLAVGGALLVVRRRLRRSKIT
jgi:fibronectin-binding autotransporter adhesin